MIELASTLGVHACNIGVPLLLEVMKEEGIEVKDDGREKEREVLKEKFTSKRGYWHAFWEEFLLLDPEFFEAYSEFSSVPWEGGGTLEPKVCVSLSILFFLMGVETWLTEDRSRN